MQELTLLILQGEGDTLEFKKTITHPDRIARTLVSFANARGGQILVGVQDNGIICGTDPDEEMYSLDLAANFFCDPPVPLSFEELDTEQGTVLIVTIPESKTKPHLAKVKENDWRGYIRVRDQSVQTSRLVEKSLALEPDPEPAPGKETAQEALLLELLRKHQRLTLKQYMNLANLSRRRAHRILVDLVLRGSVRLHDKEKEPFFTLS